MKFDSPLFDKIRVKPDKDRRAKREAPSCEWAGCKKAGTHRAPKGRGQENQYWRYCLEHVREYNNNYNYFAGLTDEAVTAFQKDALTGNRPTWKMGMNASRRAGGGDAATGGFTFSDPFNIGENIGGFERAQPKPEGRVVHNAERKALDTLGLDTDATPVQIKAKFKELVKRHHPDAHGGDRSYEDRLKVVIEAYNYLKSSGFC